jgi:thiamine biosynthesis lipoprotein
MPIPDRVDLETLSLPAAGVVETSRPGNGELSVWRAFDPDILGTRLNVVAVGASETAALAAFQSVHREISRLETILNSRRSGAELAAWNAGLGGSVSADLFDVFAASERWRKATAGAFDGRLGALVDLWRRAEAWPTAQAVQAALVASHHDLDLRADARTAFKPASMRMALDGLAKGHIVDRALEAGRRTHGLEGLLVDIGGDMRSWGAGPEDGQWHVGVGHPIHLEDDLAISRADITGLAIATSGRGARDRVIDGVRCSPTLSPFTGQPVVSNIAATVMAPRAADADALATAFLVMAPEEAGRLAAQLPGVHGRIIDAHGAEHPFGRWSALAKAPQAAKPVDTSSIKRLPAGTAWPGDWGIEIAYIAPDKREDNDRDFRSPYMALWISDAQNKPIRTISMVGQSVKWQKDNFIWWATNRTQASRLVNLRSEATALSGRYNLFWRGIDDDYDAVPMGDYILHIETSQEHGKHTHRQMPLKIGKSEFQAFMPATKEGGGLEISYGLKR